MEEKILLLFLMHNGRWWRWFETLQQKRRIQYKGNRNGDQCVHKYVQFWLAESILAQPFQHLVFAE